MRMSVVNLDATILCCWTNSFNIVCPQPLLCTYFFAKVAARSQTSVKMWDCSPVLPRVTLERNYKD